MGQDRKHIRKLSGRLDGDSMLKCYNHTTIVLVPGAGIEPAQSQGPRDFKYVLYTFYHSSQKIILHY